LNEAGKKTTKKTPQTTPNPSPPPNPHPTPKKTPKNTPPPPKTTPPPTQHFQERRISLRKEDNFSELGSIMGKMEFRDFTAAVENSMGCCYWWGKNYGGKLSEKVHQPREKNLFQDSLTSKKQQTEIQASERRPEEGGRDIEKKDGDGRFSQLFFWRDHFLKKTSKGERVPRDVGRKKQTAAADNYHVHVRIGL